MPTDTGGPLTGQDLKVYRGAPKTVGATIPDPTGAYSVPGVTADWWAGVIRQPQGYGYAPAIVAGSVGAAHKAGLAVTILAPGTVSVTWVIEPEDIASVQPGFGIPAQHEIWLTAPGGEPQPVLIGALTIVGTVYGSAAS